MNTENKTRGGRIATFANNAKLLGALVAIRDHSEAAPSRNLSLQLVEMGLVSIEKAKANEGRGAPKHNFVLSDEGVSRIALLQRSETREAVTEAEAYLAAAEAALESANEAQKEARADVAAAKVALKAATKAAAKAEIVTAPVAEEPAAEPEATPEVEAVAETVAEVEPETVAEETAPEVVEA